MEFKRFFYTLLYSIINIYNIEYIHKQMCKLDIGAALYVHMSDWRSEVGSS